MYNKPARNLADTSADLALNAPELYQQYEADEPKANIQFLDKVIKVKGNLKSFSRDENGSLNLNLDSGSEMGDVTCEVPAANVPQGLSLEVGKPITVKGQCTGFLMDVVLVKCVLVK